MSNTIFHKILSGDIPSHKVYEDDNVLAFLDINPVSPGHTLIVPKEFAPNALESSEDSLKEIWRVIQKIAPVILETVGADACNITTNHGTASGQTVFYTHFHIIPRFVDDGHKGWGNAETDHEELGKLSEKIRTLL